MTPFSDSDEAKARRATLLARKISQADEGRSAMDDYHRSHQATLDRTAKLKALRLAQQAVPVEATPTKPKRKAKVTNAIGRPKRLRVAIGDDEADAKDVGGEGPSGKSGG